MTLNWIFFTAEESRGVIFAFWCFFNTCYSIYACSWVSFFWLLMLFATDLIFIMQDFLVDYSFLQSHSKHLFLRTELMYTHQWVSPFFFVVIVWKVLIIICLGVLFCDGKPPASLPSLLLNYSSILVVESTHQIYLGHIHPSIWTVHDGTHFYNWDVWDAAQITMELL